MVQLLRSAMIPRTSSQVCVCNIILVFEICHSGDYTRWKLANAKIVTLVCSFLFFGGGGVDG